MLYPKIGEAKEIPATNSQIECDAISTEVKKVSTAGKSCILKLFEKQYPDLFKQFFLHAEIYHFFINFLIISNRRGRRNPTQEERK